MKNIFKVYIIAFLLFSNYTIYAQALPGDEGDGDGGVEGNDPGLPIDSKIIILLLLGLLFAFYKFRQHSKKTV